MLTVLLKFTIKMHANSWVSFQNASNTRAAVVKTVGDRGISQRNQGTEIGKNRNESIIIELIFVTRFKNRDHLGNF